MGRRQEREAEESEGIVSPKRRGKGWDSDPGGWSGGGTSPTIKAGGDPERHVGVWAG